MVRGLTKAGIAAEAIHGNKSQGQRDRVMAAFRAGRIQTLVATDIAARGIDVDGISHVINYDLPNIPDSYVHRIGRTARAGASGVAISFCDAEEAPFLRDIEKLIRMAIPATGQRPTPNGHRGGSERKGAPNGANGGRKQGQQRGSHKHQQHRRNRQQPRAPGYEGHIASVAFLQRGDKPRPPQAPSRSDHRPD